MTPGSDHVPSYGRAKLGQAPIAHINGAAGMHYGTTVRCSCGWRTQVNKAPSKGGRKIAEATWWRHAESSVTTPPPVGPATEPESEDVLRWALTTSALGVPHLFDNNPQDSSFVRGHQLACAQILDVIENGWVNRRDPLDIYRDLGLSW